MILAFACGHRAILLVATDPSTAEAIGLRARGLRTALAVGMGVAIGLAMHSAGTLFTFSCLVLPAISAKHLVRTMRGLVLLAPVLSVAGALVGFVIANGLDYPPGQVAAAVQAAILCLAWGVGWARGGR